MCYNLNVSLASFTTGMISGIFALYFRQPILGCLIISYSFMQLSELFIWRGIDTDNVKLNKIGTKIGKYTLPMHNIAIGIGIVIAYWSTKTKHSIWIPLIIGIIFYCGVLYIYTQKPDKNDGETLVCTDEKTCQKGAARLKWPYNHKWYSISYAISILFLIIYVRPLPPILLAIIFYTGTWLVTFYLGKRNTKISGSFWCWSTAIFVPILVIANTIINKNVHNLKS